MEKKVRILSTGDNPLVSTGYGCVWNNLLSRWAKLKPDWEFMHIGWQNQDRKHQTREGYWMLPMGKYDYGYDAVGKELMDLKPDFLVTLADVGFQNGYKEVVYEAKKKGWQGKWICYVPIDTHGWAMTWSETFAGADIVVAMAGFGEKQLAEHKIKAVLLPHGVDTIDFKPLADRDVLREKYKMSGKFVVGFVGRNQRRKMIDRLLQTFHNFAKDKEDVVLMAHTDEETPKDGWSIPYNLWQFEGLDKKVRLTKRKLDIRARQDIGPTDMNELYNLMDVFLYTTGGEGFGLPGIECQAAGVPLLMADNSTATDLCREDNRIKTLKDVYGRDMIDRGGNGVYFKYPDDVHGAIILEKHYKLWKENRAQIEREDARRFALTYDWENIANNWIKFFEQEL
jgi:glycosyltransferase involved in cell wall biosynthesis